VELATLECVSWFNHHRLLEPIGHIRSAEAEANHWSQLREKSAGHAARLNLSPAQALQQLATTEGASGGPCGGL
jgi:hypothetical protein